MPEELAAPVIPEVSLEAEPLKLSAEIIAETYALALVKQTFWTYEQFRRQNHDTRWNTNDALYYGFVPARVWEGTTVPRASLGQPISFDQIESALPAISQAVFNSGEWFDVEPEPGAQVAEARAIKDHLHYCLTHNKNDFGGTVETELEMAFKAALLYGNGGIAVTWNTDTGRPIVENIDTRDIYVDPSTPSPSIDEARSVIWRKTYTVDELDAMRSDPRMTIPERAVLVHMANAKVSVQADRTKQNAEALRGVNYSPEQNGWLPLPADRQIECLIYYSKSRIIWVLNQEFVAYNAPNPYGFVPFCFFPCFAVPGRFYGQSYADVLEGPQRYIEALMNGRLDELSLALNPPRVRKRSSILTPAQQRWRPGQVSESDDPKADWVTQFPQNVTANVMGDVEYLGQAAEKRTGVNSFGQGVPRGGNVNRTATGVTAQAQGGASRLYYIVKAIESYLIVPMLYKMYKLIQFHTQPGQMLPTLGQGDQNVQIGAQAFQSPIRFSMLAASRMMTRDKLMQILPFLTQYYLNGQFLGELRHNGQTVDFAEFQRAIQVATGTARLFNFVRPMNDQEKQAAQAPPPQVAAQQQAKQSDQQLRMQLGQLKSQTEIAKAHIMKSPDPAALQQAQLTHAAQQQDQQREMVKFAMAQQAEAQKNHMALIHAAQKNRLDQQAAASKMAADHAAHIQRIRQDQQAAALKLGIEHAKAAQAAEHADDSHQQQLAQTKAQGEADRKAALAVPKPKPAAKTS